MTSLEFLNTRCPFSSSLCPWTSWETWPPPAGFHQWQTLVALWGLTRPVPSLAMAFPSYTNLPCFMSILHLFLTSYTGVEDLESWITTNLHSTSHLTSSTFEPPQHLPKYTVKDTKAAPQPQILAAAEIAQIRGKSYFQCFASELCFSVSLLFMAKIRATQTLLFGLEIWFGNIAASLILWWCPGMHPSFSTAVPVRGHLPKQSPPCGLYSQT